MDAVDGAHVHAGRVLGFNAGVGDDERHRLYVSRADPMVFGSLGDLAGSEHEILSKTPALRQPR
jgi:hypothetical protein